MWRWFLAVAGLGLASSGSGLLAQVGLPGYMIIRVNTAADETGAAAPGGVGGGELGGLGGPGAPQPPGVGGGFPGRGGPGGRGRPGAPGVGGGIPQPPGVGGGFPGFGGGQTGNAPPIDPAKSVAVVVPYKYIAAHRTPPPWPYVLHSDLGTAYLYASKGYVQLYPLKQGFSLPSIVQAKHRTWERNRKPVQDGYDLVVEALSYGLVDRAWEYAEETAKLVEAAKGNVPVNVASFVKAFDEVKKPVADPLPNTGEAARWQSTLGAAAVEESAHYCLVHWGDQFVSREGVDRRLKALETNYKAFYLWHALSGVTLKAPDRKLVVVLADRANEMNRLHDALDGKPIVSDAFYSPNYNLVVLSPERMDEAGRAFSRFVQAKYQTGWNREELLKGKVPSLKTGAGETVATAAEMMTLALVDKLVEEEAITAQVTREGTRQLYAASGVIAQHVEPPEWLEHGVANLLNKPKGPHYWTDPNNKLQMTVGIASGYGSPNYVLVRQYRDMLNKKEINTDAEELLMNTLMDKYFDASRDGKDIDPTVQQQAGVQIGGGAAGGGLAGGGFPGFPGGGFPGGRPRPPGPGAGGPGGFPGGTGEEGGPGGFPSLGGGFRPGGAGQPQPEDPAAEQRKLKAKLDQKAQVTSWGLVFFLAKTKMPATLKFVGELNKMPRDMRLDKNQVLTTFCRCMGLTDPNNPTQINKDDFKRFAEDWVGFMKRYSSWGIDIPVDVSSDNPGQGVPAGGGGFSPFGPGGGPFGPFGPGGPGGGGEGGPGGPGG